MMTKRVFQAKIWKHYEEFGRELPWRKTRNPYRILVSEVMLQQTQAARVVPKYKEFLKKFPTVQSLAGAMKPEVLRVWQGLGYNRRALYLKRACEIVAEKHGGKFPKERGELEALPGVGPATAGAILAFAYEVPTPFLETNIRRVYLHFFFPNQENVNDKEILKLVEETMDRKNVREWYSALMDYGAMLGREKENPNRRSAHYAKQSRFEGSLREARGETIRLLLDGPKRERAIREKLGARAEQALTSLMKDGFVEKKDREFVLLK